MKEKLSDDVLIVNSESRKINESNKFAAPAPSLATNNTVSNLQIKKPSKQAIKSIYYNQLIGKKGKYTEKELVFAKQSSLIVKGEIKTDEESRHAPGNGYRNNEKKTSVDCKCFGDPKDTNTVDICLILIYILMVVFAPLGLLVFCIYYLARYREPNNHNNY